jgi:pimeloyl-ACP methyl ester carboxylesterase
MRPQHAVDLVQQLKREGRTPRTPHDLHVEIIGDAGHFVFMDQPEMFNAALLAACGR